MKEENKKLENSLIVPEKENILTRFFKWMKCIFMPSDTAIGEEVIQQAPSITIPKAVKMPVQMEESMEPDENSLEYLYKLSDDELESLNNLYDQQMEEAKNEIEKLDNILQMYKDTIKKMQGKMAEEN